MDSCFDLKERHSKLCINLLDVMAFSGDIVCSPAIKLLVNDSDEGLLMFVSIFSSLMGSSAADNGRVLLESSDSTTLSFRAVRNVDESSAGPIQYKSNNNHILEPV